MKKTALFIMFALVIGVVAVQAQAKNLIIQCNEPGAQVYINGHLAGTTSPVFAFPIPIGMTFKLTVSKEGFVPYNQDITADSVTTINVTLVRIGAAPTKAPTAPPPAAFSLSVTSNVPGSQVSIDNNPVGQTPLVINIGAGPHTVVVRHAGYGDFTQSIQVNGPSRVAATLQATSYKLSIDATNVKGAQVLINGGAVGQTPYSGILGAGTYTITIRAPGYTDYLSQVQLPGGNPTIVATLIQSTVSWQLVFPDKSINRDLKGNHISQIQVFIDGVLQRFDAGRDDRNDRGRNDRNDRNDRNNGPQGFGGQVAVGKHTLRIVAGGLASEIIFEAQAGKNLVFEPFMGITIR